LPGRRALKVILLPALAASLGGCFLENSSAASGVCVPENPSVASEQVGAGESVSVEVPGLRAPGDCTSELPSGAGYKVQLVTEDGQYRVDLGSLIPDHSGRARGEFVVPKDFPRGKSTVRIKVEGAILQCETDGSAICANSWELLRITEPSPRVP